MTTFGTAEQGVGLVLGFGKSVWNLSGERTGFQSITQGGVPTTELQSAESDILNGSAVCVYRMEDVVRAFKGNFLHKEGPLYKWAEFTGKVPYPRPGTENVLPLGERPLLVRVGVHYKFSKLLVDRVEAIDGTYDVLFIGTDSGLVLKAIHLPREHGQSQEVTLEQLQVFQHKSPVTALTLSKKKWLFVGSSEGVSQLALYQCELYGQACAECCLARDPYCTWDGHACSPYMPTVRRRNARHLGEDEDPLTQCVRQGAGLQVEAEQRVMMVAEGNSTYLECLPRSRHAAVTWYKQAGENSPELNQLVTGDQLIVIERGVLIRRAELSHGGVYHCQVEEHGYHWTAVTIRLAVWSPSANRLLASWSSPSYQSPGTQPWSEDVMPLINPRNLGQHCRALGYRPPRNHRRHDDAPCPPHVMAQVWVRNVRGMQDSKSLDEISQACGSGARGGGRGGQSEGRRATISSALELEGTVSHEGDLTNFITKNLEQKIKMSSKPSLDCSDCPIYGGRGLSRRPADIPPIDPAVLLDLQRHTQEVAHSVEMMMRSLNGTIQN
eukprot:superscaffoldBa00004525_g19032